MTAARYQTVRNLTPPNCVRSPTLIFAAACTATTSVSPVWSTAFQQHEKDGVAGIIRGGGSRCIFAYSGCSDLFKDRRHGHTRTLSLRPTLDRHQDRSAALLR